jgi:hypothetical protein
MTRLFTIGFESGHQLGENGVSFTAGNTQAQSTKKRSGGFAAKFDSSAGTNAYYGTNTTSISSGWGYARVYMCFDALPNSTIPVVRWTDSAVTSLLSARLTSAGKLQLWNDVTAAQVGSDSTATIAADGTTWYRIELGAKVGNPAVANDDSIELQLDGVSVASQLNFTLTASTSLGSLRFGWIGTSPGATKVCYADDIAINNEVGGIQGSWPGDGKIILLKPTADSARAAKWTGGAGGTTNLWDAVNNTPPGGLVSASATNTSQIEHAGAATGTTDAYDATMETYTAAGVGASDYVSVVQAVMIHGEDIATGTKTLSLSIVSNPAVSSTGPFNAGNDVGAVGTYPSSWGAGYEQFWHLNPGDVTLGTAPVMRVVRPETASRVASVAMMGILVDYTPAVAPSGGAPPPRNRLMRRMTQIRM